MPSVLTSPFFRRLFLPYLLLICAAVTVVGVAGAQRLRSSFIERTHASLADETRLMALILTDNLRADRLAELAAHANQLGRTVPDRRITLIAEDGTVIADNEASPATLDNHRFRPEIVAAANLGEGRSIRPSSTLGENLMYYARRVQGSDQHPYYLRVAIHLRDLDRHLRALYARIALAGGLAALGAAVICYAFARRHALPLVQLTRFADALREGDFSRRVVRRGQGEIDRLGQALNAMADSLSQLIAQNRQDKSQLLTVLSSMGEGVIATDHRQRILFANAAAARLLDTDPQQAAGKLLWEVVRIQAILVAAGDVLADGQSRQLEASSSAARHLEIAISTCLDGDVQQGLVIVMRDVTDAARFQNLRKEFVANVSHELRTPLTAIKGFAETLRDGAMNDPQRGPQYLATIVKHADQLANLVSDLLELSRLDSHHEVPHLQPVHLSQAVRRAADLLRSAAEDKHQTLTVTIPPQLPPIQGNSNDLERAVANLLENAIKYTPESGTITVSVAVRPPYLVLEVTDNGIGIPQADLPRIFERFYRVDRSRSREMGGTGLGLSIVKHIAQVHGGNIEVTSSPSHGSTFRLHLPVSQDPA